MKRLLFTLAMLLLLAGQGWAATYYMRADGSAANKAASVGPVTDASKCMSVTTHNAQTFSSGDTITVSDKGGVYKTTLTAPSAGTVTSGVTYPTKTSPANNISYVADGTPVFDCADAVSAASWTKDGANNDYSASVSPAVAGPGFFVKAWQTIGGVTTELTRAANLAGCRSTAGTYYPTSDTAAPLTLYVHLTDDAAPGDADHIVETAMRQYAFVAANYNTVNGINTKRNLGNNGSLLLGYRNTCLNGSVNDGGYHNLYTDEGTYIFNTTISGFYYSGLATTFAVINKNVGLGEDIVFDTVSINNNGTFVTDTTGIYSHTNTSGSFGTVYINNCTIGDCLYAVQLPNTTAVSVTNLTATNAATIYQAIAGQPLTVNGTTCSTWAAGQYPCIVRGADTTTALTFSNLNVSGLSWTAFYHGVVTVSGSTLQGVDSNDILAICTSFTCTDSTIKNFQYWDQGSAAMTLKRNKMSSTNPTGNTIDAQITMSVVLQANLITDSNLGVWLKNVAHATVDNNTFNAITGEAIYGFFSTIDHVRNNILSNGDYTIYKNGGTVSDITNNDFYNNTHGVSGISNPIGSNGNINSDPKYVNAGAGNFKLQATSPCKWTGVAIAGVTTDLAGLPYMPTPSMGAYEVMPSGGLTPGLGLTGVNHRPQ